MAAIEDAYEAAGDGAFRLLASEAAVRRISRRGASVRSGRVAGSEKWGIGMFAGLVWRTILFFGLTAGYAILAALPYLA